MRHLLFIVFFVVSTFVATQTVFAQDVDDQLGTTVVVPNRNDGYFYPQAGSSRSMEKCGMTEAQIPSNFIEVILTAPVKVARMKYCDPDLLAKATRAGRVYNGSWTDHLLPLPGTTANRPIILGVGVRVFVDPNNPGHAFAAGCLNEFYGMRINIPPPVIVTPRPTPTPAPVEEFCENLPNLTLDEAEAQGYELVKLRSGKYKCVNEVKPTSTPTPTEEECEDCSVFKITDAKFVSKGWKAYAPSRTEVLVAVLDGGFTSLLGSNTNRRKSVLIGVGGSLGKTAIYNIATPDKNSLILAINGQDYTVPRKKKESIKVKKGDATLTLNWTGDQILGKLDDGTICFTAYVQNGFTVGTMTVIYRGGKKQTVAIKTPPSNPTQGPVRPPRQFFTSEGILEEVETQPTQQNLTNTNYTPFVAAPKTQLGPCEREMNINGVVQIRKVC